MLSLIKILISSCLFFLSSGFLFCLFVVNPTFLITWLIILRFILRLVFLNNFSTWLMYAVVLLFTGGIIVLFSYITSLVMSSKISFPRFPKYIISIWLILIIFCTQIIFQPSQKIISTLFFESSASILLILAFYLLLVLIRIVKIATSISGPIKSFFTYEK